MNKQMERQYALDWVRIMATVAVFLFHSGAAFTAGNWHLNNPETGFAITVWNTWLLIWVMPIFFFLSGASTYFSLRTRTVNQFMRSRFLRLALPLVFGILLIVPPQVYLERVSRAQFRGSFWDFYPHYFDGWYLDIGGSGNFAWMGLHLWYLLLLFVMSIIMLPLLRWVEQDGKIRNKLTYLSGQPGMLLFYPLPIILIEMLWGNVGVGGWNIATYPLFFLYGYFLFSRLDVRMISKRFTSLAFSGAVASSALLLLSLFADGPVAYGQYTSNWQVLLHAFSGWFWIMAILGLAYRYLSFSNDLLKYGHEAVLPFYILHQTWIIILGFFAMRMDWYVGFKYAFVILFSFAAILLSFEILKRIRFLRFLFGLKSRPSKKVIITTNR